MANINFGYACINLTLRHGKPRVTTNRNIRQKTFEKEGLNLVSQLVLQNLNDLDSIINWNYLNQIYFYRMSSSMFPWWSEYELEELPNFEKIKDLLFKIGQNARKYNQRLTFHPGHFNILSSYKSSVIIKTIHELQQHSKVLDLMGYKPSVYNKINIHINGAYGDKSSAIKRFITNFKYLNYNTRQRITIENDDRKNLFSTYDLKPIYEEIGIPIVFDFFHHFCQDPPYLNMQQSYEYAINTWPKKIRPVIHFSSSKKINEDNSSRNTAHADWLYKNIPDYVNNVDCMLESKMKEKSLLEFSTYQ